MVVNTPSPNATRAGPGRGICRRIAMARNAGIQQSSTTSGMLVLPVAAPSPRLPKTLPLSILLSFALASLLVPRWNKTKWCYCCCFTNCSISRWQVMLKFGIYNYRYINRRPFIRQFIRNQYITLLEGAASPAQRASPMQWKSPDNTKIGAGGQWCLYLWLIVHTLPYYVLHTVIVRLPY